MFYFKDNQLLKLFNNENQRLSILNNDLLPKYKLKSKCNWFSIVKMNKKRSKLENKLRISRFDSKNGLFLFDPLSFNFINLKQNEKRNSNTTSVVKCQIFHGKSIIITQIFSIQFFLFINNFRF